MAGPSFDTPDSANTTPDNSVDKTIDALIFTPSPNPSISTEFEGRADLTPGIPGMSSELDEQQISLLNDLLEQAYLHQHPDDAIVVQTQDPRDLNPQTQHPILPTYNIRGEIDHYFSFGDFITKRGQPTFTEENVSSKISTEFIRLLSAFILSDKPIPDSLSCYFGIHHGGHWTTLVIKASIGAVEKDQLIKLQHFFKNLEKPYSLDDYGTIHALLFLIGGNESDTNKYELNTRLPRLLEKPPHYSIADVQTLIATLKADYSADKNQHWFVPYFHATEISLMDSLNGLCNQSIERVLSSLFPNISIQKPLVPLQGSNHCGDNTIWNGFYYSIHGGPCAARLSNTLRELSIQACKSEVANKRNADLSMQLDKLNLEQAKQLLAHNPPIKAKTVSHKRTSSPELSVAPMMPMPTSINPTLRSRVGVLLKLDNYLSSYFRIIKDFLIALFSFNIFGLGFRKYLMAKKLRKELSRHNTSISEATNLIIKYDEYNTYLENHKPLLWLENFRPIHPEEQKYDISNCSVPEDSAFYKALHR